MKHTLRTKVGRLLNVMGLRSVARRIEWAIRPKKFRADTDVTPVAVERAMKSVVESGLLDRGDYYEFGIYRGYTLWHAQQVAQRLGNTSMRFVGLDSFSGFPEVKGVDRYHDDFVKGQFAAGLKYVRDMLTEHGIDWDRTVLVPGYYQDTLTDDLKKEHGLSRAALIVIDCVLYESTVLALQFLGELFVDGAIVIFDDWNAFDSDDGRGERKAFREFLDAHAKWAAEPLFDYGTYGKAFRLNLTPASSRG